MLETITSAVSISGRLYDSARQAAAVAAKLKNAKLDDVVADMCIDAAELRSLLAKLEIKGFTDQRNDRATTA